MPGWKAIIWAPSFILDFTVQIMSAIVAKAALRAETSGEQSGLSLGAHSQST